MGPLRFPEHSYLSTRHRTTSALPYSRSECKTCRDRNGAQHIVRDVGDEIESRYGQVVDNEPDTSALSENFNGDDRVSKVVVVDADGTSSLAFYRAARDLALYNGHEVLRAEGGPVGTARPRPTL